MVQPTVKPAVTFVIKTIPSWSSTVIILSIKPAFLFAGKHTRYDLADGIRASDITELRRVIQPLTHFINRDYLTAYVSVAEGHVDESR
jgi:hypothetical protein